MSDRGQIAKLADFIMAEAPGEPSRSEGAGDVAIRIMREQQQIIRELEGRVARLSGRLADAQIDRDGARDRVESLRVRLASRDAVIARVAQWHDSLDGPPRIAEMRALGAFLDAAPESVLAEVKADAWDEGLIAGHKQTGAQYPNAGGNPYRKGAGQ